MSIAFRSGVRCAHHPWWLLLAVACAPAPKSPNVGTEAPPVAVEAAPQPAAPGATPAAGNPGQSAADISAQPLVLSLYRDSLQLAVGASNEQVKSAVDSAIATLRRVHEFEVLAVSAPILAAKIRPVKGESSANLIKAIGSHRLVKSLTLDGVVTTQGRGNH